MLPPLVPVVNVVVPLVLRTRSPVLNDRSPAAVVTVGDAAAKAGIQTCATSASKGREVESGGAHWKRWKANIGRTAMCPAQTRTN